MKLKLILSTILSFLLFVGFSQDEKAKTLVESIQKHTYNLKIEDGKFTGSGANILLEAIPACQFLLVGEQHGISEVGQFSKVLFEEANANSGFQYMAIETDPFMAAKIQELAQGSVEDVKTLSSKYPLAIPFYNNSEDFDFLKTVEDKSTAETTFWGLDQVFAAAPRYLFDLLATLAENKQAVEVAQEYSKKAQDGFNQAMSTGQMDKAIVNCWTKEDFERLLCSMDPPRVVSIDGTLEKAA